MTRWSQERSRRAGATSGSVIDVPDTKQALVLTNSLDRWDLTLATGEAVTIWAHGVAERDEHYVFVALMRGEPHFEMELCRFPLEAVSELVGG